MFVVMFLCGRYACCALCISLERGEIIVLRVICVSRRLSVLVTDIGRVFDM